MERKEGAKKVCSQGATTGFHPAEGYGGVAIEVTAADYSSHSTAGYRDDNGEGGAENPKLYQVKSKLHI